MKLLQNMVGSVIRWVTERGASNLTYEELRHRLEESGRVVAERIAAGDDTARNLAQARHIIGIERWGQQRLRVVLGEPFIEEEYDAHRPETVDAMGALQHCFEEARVETVSLTRELEEHRIDPQMTVPHNALGSLTIRGWLFYLHMHANRESHRID